MITVRPIQSDEITYFASIETKSDTIPHIVSYMDQMISKNSMRVEWCFVAEEEGKPLGRIAYWTLPKSEVPMAIVLLDVPWYSLEMNRIGAALLQKSLPLMHSLESERLNHVIDSPSQFPQWQQSLPERTSWLEENHFHLERKTDRWQLEKGEKVNSSSGDLRFRSLSEVGEANFIEAIMRVSKGTLDQFIQND